TKYGPGFSFANICMRSEAFPRPSTVSIHSASSSPKRPENISNFGKSATAAPRGWVPRSLHLLVVKRNESTHPLWKPLKTSPRSFIRQALAFLLSPCHKMKTHGRPFPRPRSHSLVWPFAYTCPWRTRPCSSPAEAERPGLGHG